MALRTPLYDWHLARGARMVEFGGWDMPIQYSTIVDEHQAVRTAAGLFDISHMGRIVFTGPDAGAFLHYLVSSDILGMKPGQIRYGLACNEQGGIRDDVLVYRLEPFWLLVVNASNRLKMLDWIEAQRGKFNCQLEDRTPTWGMLAIQGPTAIGPHVTGPWGLFTDPGALRYYFGTTKVSPIEIISRTGYTGEDGFEVILENSRLVKLADAILAAGIKPTGLGARDTLRLEAAMPLYGHELSETIDPLQAGLGWAVKLEKENFLGKAALLERQKDASRPVRIGLELAGKRIAREGAEVRSGEQVLGTVASGTFAPTLQKAIAMAYVPPAFSAVGTTLTVNVRGNLEQARVVALPFYKRKK
jgi:aminomethyltransferase